MYDLAIIGGGPGGYVAAIRGAQQGLKVLLVEKDSLGGTCLNRGCISTKCFIHDAKILQAAKTSSVLTGGNTLSIDPVKMVARKRQVVGIAVAGLWKIIKSHGIEVMQGRGELMAPGRVNVGRTDGSIRQYNSRHIVLATGSQPSVLPFIDVDGHYIQTTDEALDSEDIPERLVIIGGGVIGLEMACIYRTLGSKVIILELLPDIIINEEMEIRRAMRILMEQHGIRISLKATVKEVAARDGRVEGSYEDETGQIQVFESDRVLVATGREPILDGIDHNKLGLKTDGPYIKVNSRLETSLPGVYALGDLVGGMMLAHKASAEGEATVANILGGNKEVKQELIPRCIWGFTEVGSVGLTEEEARATGRGIKVGKFHYMNSAAAQAMEDVNGLVKIVGDSETGEILGVHIIGPHATDLIGEPVMAMTMEAAMEDLAEAIKPHPTLSETIMEAAMDWSGMAIHSPKKKQHSS